MAKIVRRKNNDLFGTIFIYAVVIFASVITLYPFLYVIANSFSSPLAVLRREVVVFPKEFSIQSYRMLLGQKEVFLAYFNTLWYTVVGTLVNISLTVMAGYALSIHRFFLRKPLSMMITATLFVSGGIIPSYIIVRMVGLYDTRWALVLPTAISAYNLIVARSFFESLPKELAESAHLDGANDFTVLTRIIIPVSKSILAVLTIFYAVGHWNEYFNPMIYLKSRELKPIQLYLRDILVANEQTGVSTGGNTSIEQKYLFEALKFSTIVITTLPITIIYPFFQKYFVKGVMIGAVKS
ncbi:MAG: carbohydrate ABC transporter permease [Clostridiales bacterium]|nr:carbohydrate ABC transporter permease [Clostridiales bacterium]